MGQGTDGMNEEYYEVNCNFKVWSQRNGQDIAVSSMSLNHLRNTRYFCIRSSYVCDDEDIKENIEEWITVLDAEIKKRVEEKKRVFVKKPVRGKQVHLTCTCGKVYLARVSDINRGWGKSCSKSCAALKK